LVIVVFVVVVAIVLIAAGLAIWGWRARSCGRVIDAPDGTLERVFLGGIMCKRLMTGGTMVRLEMFDWGVRIRGIAPTRWVVPTWEARYEELAIAELVSSPFSRIAVWFRLRGETDGMGFLSQWNQDILKVLQAHEVPVNRAVARFKRVDELYRARS
jgi:hypothetical protein